MASLYQKPADGSIIRSTVSWDQLLQLPAFFGEPVLIGHHLIVGKKGVSLPRSTGDRWPSAAACARILDLC